MQMELRGRTLEVKILANRAKINSKWDLDMVAQALEGPEGVLVEEPQPEEVGIKGDGVRIEGTGRLVIDNKITSKTGDSLMCSLSACKVHAA